MFKMKNGSTQDGLLEIHEYGLRLLEKSGVMVEDREALEMLASAGSRVSDGRAYLPRSLVNRALEATQESSGQVQLYSR